MMISVLIFSSCTFFSGYSSNNLVAEIPFQLEKNRLVVQADVDGIKGS